MNDNLYRNDINYSMSSYDDKSIDGGSYMNELHVELYLACDKLDRMMRKNNEVDSLLERQRACDAKWDMMKQTSYHRQQLLHKKEVRS